MNMNDLLKKQVAIINVGISTRDGVPGPLFDDGTFRFVPISESRPTENTPTYREMGLEKWVSYPDRAVHCDPEFETMTYGDYEHKTRTANAKKLKLGDFLFFFASLSNKEDRRRREVTGFYLIGYFEIDRIIPYDEAKTSRLTRNNAHRKRISDTGFSIWKGTRRSSLFEYVVPMNRSNVDRYLRTSKKERLPWGKVDRRGHERTPLEVINSATRASRMIEAKYRKNFWKTVIEKNPYIPILN